MDKVIQNHIFGITVLFSTSSSKLIISYHTVSESDKKVTITVFNGILKLVPIKVFILLCVHQTDGNTVHNVTIFKDLIIMAIRKKIQTRMVHHNVGPLRKIHVFNILVGLRAPY